MTAGDSCSLANPFAGIFNNCMDKTGKNSYCKKQAKAAFP